MCARMGRLVEESARATKAVSRIARVSVRIRLTSVGAGGDLSGTLRKKSERLGVSAPLLFPLFQTDEMLLDLVEHDSAAGILHHESLVRKLNVRLEVCEFDDRVVAILLNELLLDRQP